MSTRFSDLSWRMKVFLIALPLFLFAVLWNIASWRPHGVGAPTTVVKNGGFTFIDGKPTAVAVSPDNKILAISRTHLVHGNAWGYASNQIDLQTGFRWGKLAKTLYAPKKAVARRDISISLAPFHKLYFSPDSKFVAGVDVNNNLAVINTVSGATPLILKQNHLPNASPYHTRNYRFVGFSRDSNRVLVLECWRRKDNVKNAEANALHNAVLLQISTINGLVVSRVPVQLKAGEWPERAILINDKAFVCSTERGDTGSPPGKGATAAVLDVQTGKIIRVLASGHSGTYSMASHENQVAISFRRWLTKPSTVIYDLSSKQEVALDDDNRGTNNLTFSPDGKQIAGTQDGAIWLWNTSTGKGIRRVGTNPSIMDLTFSPDGKTIVSADLKSAKIWRAQ